MTTSIVGMFGDMFKVTNGDNTFSIFFDLRNLTFNFRFSIFFFRFWWPPFLGLERTISMNLVGERRGGEEEEGNVFIVYFIIYFSAMININFFRNTFTRRTSDRGRRRTYTQSSLVLILSPMFPLRYFNIVHIFNILYFSLKLIFNNVCIVNILYFPKNNLR
jgi:hypothetical protein